MLEVAHSIHALEFLFAHGILTVPLYQHFYLPWLELKVIVVLHGKARPDILVVQPPTFVFAAYRIGITIDVASVAGSHIEIGTGEVALVFVFGFKHPEIRFQRVMVYLADPQRPGIRLDVFFRRT